MKTYNLFRSTIVAFSLVAVGSASATVLPGFNEMTTTQRGDFQVYSLGLLVDCAADPRCQPSSGIPIDSNAGFTKDQLVIFSGENGNPQTTNYPSPINTQYVADNVFSSPSGNQSSTFIMGSAVSPEPAPNQPQFAGDRGGWWDITIGALRQYLGTHDLVFIFDNSQEGDGANQWLNIWGQAQVVDANGNSKACFELNGSQSAGCQVDLASSQPDLSSYVNVFTGYCVDKTTGVAFDLGLGSQNYCANKNAYYVNGNIGSAVADNAAFSQGLNDFVFGVSTDENWLLSLNIRTDNNNGSAETLWICSNCDVSDNRVPEPASIALVGAALLGLGAWRRRQSLKE